MMHFSADISRSDVSAVASPAARVESLNRRFDGWEPLDVLRVSLSEMGRVALVSSFGAESAVLLHMASRVDASVPILFIDTEMLFPETLAYQRDLTEAFGLTGVVVMRAGDSAVKDPDGTLHQRDTDACCALRKTAPLQTALSGFDAWVSGRKRFQSGTRAELEHFEAEAGTGRIKINPLAHWGVEDVQAYMAKHDLPRHPLVAQGYPSIGCAPCTTPVAPGEDPRAGRWRDEQKEECGIHFVNGKVVRGGGNT